MPNPVWLYLRSRRTLTGIALTLVLCGLLPLVGMLTVPFPSEGSGTGTAVVPAWRVLAAGVTFGVVPFCQSPFGEMEAATGRNWRRTEMVVLVASATVCTVLFTLTCALALGETQALLTLRGTIGWMAIAVLTGRILSWRIAGIGPLLILPLMIFWGVDELPHYHWWEFTARPAGDQTAWLTVAGLAAIGALSCTFDRWRWLPLTRLLSHKR